MQLLSPESIQSKQLQKNKELKTKGKERYTNKAYLKLG